MAAPAVGDRVLLNVAALDRGLGTGGYALVIAVLDPRPGHAPSRRSRPGTWSRPATCRCRRWWPGPTSRARRTTSCCATPTPSTGCRCWWPTCTPPSPPPCWPWPTTARDARVVYVMTDQGALPLAFSRSVAELRGCRAAGRHGHRRASLRRRPGGRHRALRAAGGPAGPRRRPGGPDPGPGQSGHRHPMGLLRGGGRRGGQRRGRPGRASGRGAADLRRPTPGRGTAGSPITA